MVWRFIILTIIFSGNNARKMLSSYYPGTPNVDGVNKSWETILTDTLIPYGTYDFNSPPLKEGNAVTVEMILESFDLDIEKHSLQTHLGISMMWSDNRLVWSPGDYGGVKFFRAYSNRVWNPEIMLVNGNNGVRVYGHCMIQYTGQVTCMAYSYIGHSVTNCPFDMSEYPYDVQRCSITFGSWSTTADQLDVTLETFVRSAKEKYSSEYSVISNSTAIIDYDEHFGNLYYHNKAIEVNFTFKHINTIFEPVIRLPFAMGLILTGLCLWLNPANLSLRLRVMSICLPLFFAQLMYIGMSLKHGSMEVPYAVTAISQTFAISTVLVAWYIIAYRMVYCQPMSHKFTRILNHLKPGLLGISIGKSKSKLVSESTEGGCHGDMEIDESWFILTVLIDRIFFIAFVHFILFSRF